MRAAEQALLERIETLASYARPNPRRDSMANYSLRSAIQTMAHDRHRSGLEFEISQDLERTQPAKHGGVVVPWEVFTRADIVGTNSAGGYLVETINLDAADALRPNMIAGGLGATIIPAPYSANVNLPRQTGVATAAWLSTETSTISEVDDTFGQISFTPHTVAGYTEFSRLLMLQGGPSPTEFVVRRDLLGVVARALDLAVFFGTGAAGQPHGLAGLSGVGTFSGTSLALAGVVDAAVALGDGLDDSAGIAANRTVAGTLKKRQEATGSTRLMWEGSLIAGTCIGFPARSSSALSSGSMFLGSWRFMNIIIWGGGVEIAVNPYGDQASGAGNFAKGIIGVRAFLTADCAPTFSSAFTYASTVT